MGIFSLIPHYTWVQGHVSFSMYTFKIQDSEL